MKESYREGVASHPGPQPCEGGREAALEAWERGIPRQDIQLRNPALPGADAVRAGGRQHGGGRQRETALGPAESKTPGMRRNFLYGFRPGRGPQDALDALWVGIVRKKVSWIVDLDIRSFFDKLQQAWLVKFVEHRIGDRRITRLIQKWLKAGVLEQGQWTETKEGSPQGAVMTA